MVVELVGAFNELTERMKVLSSKSSGILFKALKLSIPILLPLSSSSSSSSNGDIAHGDGRSPLSKALSLALLLADLQMDAEVISAGILRRVFEAGAISLPQIRDDVGAGTAHLLHESLRLNNIPSRFGEVAVGDEEGASAFRKFCLAYYDIRALVLDLALKLDTMRHLHHLPRFQQQLLSLQVLNFHAPLAHAVAPTWLSLELQDLAFHYLFPYSYLYIDAWLRSHESGGKPLIDVYLEQLRQSLKADPILGGMVEDISIKGRYKSRYSTMKKLLKDGRKPQDVNDVLGLRVILKPRSRHDMSEMELGEQACYRTREIIQSMWKEIPHRTKDYIATPKPNGYRSLHMAVDVSENGKARPLMEIQIRTTEMDLLAVAGTASHSLYKGGLTDPKEAKRLKAIMMAAAEVAALRLRDLPSAKQMEIDSKDRAFRLLDKNGDGRISIEELMEVMEELGAPGEDAREMMQLLDSNSDGSLSSEEFDIFQKEVEFMRKLEDKDKQFKALLDEKLQMTEDSGLIQVYSQELGNRLAN